MNPQETAPIEPTWLVQLRAEAALGRQLVAILMDYCGVHEDEGAVETLRRLAREWDAWRPETYR